MPNTQEVVIHTLFLERGLLLPLNPFLRGLLFYYGIQPHNLNPNRILHIACFIILCESFLGIEPHFSLWKNLFIVKPQLSQEKISIDRGAGIQLRLGVRYNKVPARESNKGWQKY